MGRVSLVLRENSYLLASDLIRAYILNSVSSLEEEWGLYLKKHCLVNIGEIPIYLTGSHMLLRNAVLLIVKILMLSACAVSTIKGHM